MTAATHFLSTYVTDDGRVLRHDQGDDIVSEGQAYGMLIAEMSGRDHLARTIWWWTDSHLRDRDGLLAYHADAQGHVLDHQPAADADSLMAFALLRYSGGARSAMHAAGRRLAAAVLEHETVQDSRGRTVLVAGPWATDPAIVNPSYWMPSVFDDLGHLTGVRAWTDMARTAVELTDQVTRRGTQLPPDWGRLEGDHITPTGSGGGAGSPQYGPDAQRVPLFFGYSCDGRARRLAAAWWSLLQQDDRSSATALTLDAQPVDPTGSTVALLGSAAAARAGGDRSGASDLETGADQTDQGRPSYYGAAWLALSTGLRDGALAGCAS